MVILIPKTVDIWDGSSRSSELPGSDAGSSAIGLLIGLVKQTESFWWNIVSEKILISTETLWCSQAQPCNIMTRFFAFPGTAFCNSSVILIIVAVTYLKSQATEPCALRRSWTAIFKQFPWILCIIGIQSFGLSGWSWVKRNCLGLYIK